MSDLLQVSDLEKAKKHDTFHVEAVTGKVGGLAGGADIDYTTNAVTGQVQKTLPKILADIDWSYVGLFADGVTFTKRTDFALDGVGIQWVYVGAYPFAVAAGTVPTEPLYQVVHVRDHNSFSNRNSAGAHDANAINTATGNVQSDISMLQSNQGVIERNFNVSMSTIFGKLVAGTAAGVKIAFSGDSTMWGSEPAPNTTTQQSSNPPATFKIGLDILFPSNSVTILNEAIPGSSLYSMIRGINNYYPTTYAQRLASILPKVVYCNHCLNDCSAADGLTNINQYYLDLISFVDITRSFGAIPVLVTPMIHAPLGAGVAAQTKRQESFIQAMRDVADKKGVDLVDCNKFTQKTLRLFKPYEIAPDGVHLGPLFSAQYGYNMLIPLLRPHTLSKVGDIAGISNTYWQDNLPDVFNKITNNIMSDFGPTLLGDAGATDLKINFPIILDDATSDTFLGFGGYAWDTHGVSNITYFDGYGTAGIFDGEIDASVQTSTNNALFAPFRCRLPAGLSIIGVKLPSTQVGKVFSFAGVKLLPKIFSGNGDASGTGAVQVRPIMRGDSINSRAILRSGETLLSLGNADDLAQTIIEIKWDSGTNTIIIVHPSGTTTLWDSPTESTFGLKLIIDQKSFIVQLGGLIQTISGLTYSLPKLIVTDSTSYTVTRS